HDNKTRIQRLLCHILLSLHHELNILKILLSFFLYFYGSLQVLHSFPTRRSSDLRGAGAPPCAHPRHLEVRHRPHLPRAARSPVEDRKSTRLNSSHRTISYAVFCLKKKKELSSTTNTIRNLLSFAKEIASLTCA